MTSPAGKLALEDEQDRSIRSYLAALEHEGQPGQEVEDAFILAVKDHAERNGLSYAAWREIGVPAAVLNKAGMPRTARRLARTAGSTPRTATADHH